MPLETYAHQLCWELPRFWEMQGLRLILILSTSNVRSLQLTQMALFGGVIILLLGDVDLQACQATANMSDPAARCLNVSL